MQTDTLSWNDSFKLGHSKMDETHREFVECVQALSSASDSELKGALRALKFHLIRHFEQEDSWMESTAFPAKDCHIDEHAQVLKTVSDVELLLQKGNFQVCRQLALELAKWFPGHADYLDSALAIWMSKLEYGGAPVVIRRDIVR